MKNPSKQNLGKLGILLLAGLCIAVFAYDMAGARDRAAQNAPQSTALEPPEPQTAADEETISVSAAVDEELPEDSFYSEYHLEREQVRAEELELLGGIIGDVNTTKEMRDKANERKLQIAQNMEYELMTEKVLLAKDYGQTVVMLGQDSATVILSGPLDEIAATQVAEAVSGVTGVAFENIVIINR